MKVDCIQGLFDWEFGWEGKGHRITITLGGAKTYSNMNDITEKPPNNSKIG